MLITGLSGVILIEIYAAVMQREFQNTDNQVSKGFAILGIYLFVVCSCETHIRLEKEAELSADCVYLRWHAQQHHMAVRRRSSSHCSQE